MPSSTAANEPSVAEKDTHSTVTQSQDNQNEYEDAERNYQPKTLKFWTILIGMYLSMFLVALDRMIIATAVPKITDEFKSINDIGWYGSAYMLTAAVFFPISGRIYQIYSTKWVYVGSIIIFEVGSAICGAAPNSIAFILGRAIAGSGSSGIFTGGIMIMMPMVPLRKRPTFAAFFGMAFGLASVLGPVIGGLFTDKVTWRWCFYLNLPVGGFTLVAVLLLFNFDQMKKKSLPTVVEQIKALDPLGVFFLAPSMVCLVLALQWGGTTSRGADTNHGNGSCSRHFEPLHRGGMLFMFLLSGAMMSAVYYLAIWFQTTKGDSAMDAGIKTIPLVLSMVVFTILSAKLTERIGYYVPAMLICPILCSVGGGMLSTLDENSGHSKWIGYQVLYGFGMGCGFQGPNLAAQTVLPRVDVPIGIALLFFMQQLGGAIFVSVSQNIFANELLKRLSGVAGLDTEAVLHQGATELRKIVPPSELDVVIKAYNVSITRVFVMVAALSASIIIGSLAMEWKSIKGRDGGDTGVSKDAEGGQKNQAPEKE
uniref:Major facilitator superfamily (MFS) profile domain-containing protein n=1 Tax=Bionectria ochroleuca TaxID=29856 RepID=A0A8H7MYZ5_BIOOC